MRRRTPILPGFQLLEFLGGGPNSEVWSALALGSTHHVAVKILRVDDCSDPLPQRLFRREVAAGLAVRHQHIVRIHSAQLDEEPNFLVMDLLHGETLRQRLRREYALNMASAVWIARQVAEGLAALHRAGTIHGDLKPENIRLLDNGLAVLIDLGFAHQPGDNDEILADGFVLGTANYLAPELCATESVDDYPADLFSFGVILFEMLTGELPYPLGSARDTLVRHRDDKPRDLTEFPGDWPHELVALVRKLTQKRPYQRPCALKCVQELVGLEIRTMPRRTA